MSAESRLTPGGVDGVADAFRRAACILPQDAMMRRRQHVAKSVAKRIEATMECPGGHSPEVPIQAMAGKAEWESWQRGLSESAVPEGVHLEPVSPDSGQCAD